MRCTFEIVHLVDGHLVDAESYESTALPMLPREYEPGYYLLPWSHQEGVRHVDPAAGLQGPYTSAEDATRALGTLKVQSSAIERGSECLPAPGTLSHGIEVKP